MPEHGDPFCPCPDGLACHYVDLPGSPAMTPPTEPEIEVLVAEAEDGYDLSPEDFLSGDALRERLAPYLDGPGS